MDLEQFSLCIGQRAVYLDAVCRLVCCAKAGSRLLRCLHPKPKARYYILFRYFISYLYIFLFLFLVSAAQVFAGANSSVDQITKL